MGGFGGADHGIGSVVISDFGPDSYRDSISDLFVVLNSEVGLRIYLYFGFRMFVPIAIGIGFIIFAYEKNKLAFAHKQIYF